MSPELARLLFPKILNHLIRIQMTNMAIPFAITHTITSGYLTTLKEVLVPEGSAS